MGSVVETSTAAGSSARQPAFGEYVDYPELERDEQAELEECAADRSARRMRVPGLFVLAVLETAWLVGLAYLLYRLVG